MVLELSGRTWTSRGAELSSVWDIEGHLSSFEVKYVLGNLTYGKDKPKLGFSNLQQHGALIINIER